MLPNGSKLSCLKVHSEFFQILVGWDDNLSELKIKSIDAHSLWKDNGRPRSGEIYNIMRTAKAKYKLAKRNKNKDVLCVFSNDLHDHQMAKDQQSFWKTWSAKFTNNKRLSDVIDGSNGPTAIADKFASVFHKACTPNSSAGNSRPFYEFLGKYDSYDKSISTFSVEAIQRSLCRMKLHKAGGVGGIESEHLLYAHPFLLSLLCLIFMPSQGGRAVTRSLSTQRTRVQLQFRALGRD